MKGKPRCPLGVCLSHRRSQGLLIYEEDQWMYYVRQRCGR